MPDTPKDKLKKMTAWNVDPQLTDAEIDELLIAASLADSTGLPPSDPAWTPTYDLNLAAVSGWTIKAGRASALVEVDPPGSGLFSSKVFDNCRAMARIYRAKCRLSVRCGPSA
jgi:hypothetical protein